MTLLELLQLLRKHLRLVIALPLVCALVMGVYSYLFMPNTYTASTSMYVLVKGDSTAKTSMSQDLSASQMIANDVSTLIKCCVPIGCLRRRCATWAAGPRTRCADAPNYSVR